MADPDSTYTRGLVLLPDEPTTPPISCRHEVPEGRDPNKFLQGILATSRELLVGTIDDQRTQKITWEEAQEVEGLERAGDTCWMPGALGIRGGVVTVSQCDEEAVSCSTTAEVVVLDGSRVWEIVDLDDDA